MTLRLAVDPAAALPSSGCGEQRYTPRLERKPGGTQRRPGAARKIDDRIRLSGNSVFKSVNFDRGLPTVAIHADRTATGGFLS